MGTLRRGLWFLKTAVAVGAAVSIVLMLMLVWGSVVRTSRRAICSNSLRSLTQMALQYADTGNDGRLPTCDFEPEPYSAGQWTSFDVWVWELGLVDPCYYTGTWRGTIPRDSNRILRCPNDTKFVVNGQRALSSYFYAPVLSGQPLKDLVNRPASPVFFEGDPFYLTDSDASRFLLRAPPYAAADYHGGGSHCAFLDGSVRLIGTTDPAELILANYELHTKDGTILDYPGGGARHDR